MSDIKLELSIKEEDFMLFKRCVRKLLNSTFIVGEKDEKLYSYISRESNRQDISSYLRMSGFDVLVDTNVRIAMLRSADSDEEMTGMKRSNIVRFTQEEYHILLVLWEIYLENVGFSEENVVTLGDLIDKLKAYEVDAGKKDLSDALKTFKRFDLINFDLRDYSEEMPITLYPSLQFGWNLPQLKTVAAEYIHTDDEPDDVLDVEEEE